jgi:hypothetical protein
MSVRSWNGSGVVLPCGKFDGAMQGTGVVLVPYAVCSRPGRQAAPRASLLERFPLFGLYAVEKMERITNNRLVTALASDSSVIQLRGDL